MRHLFNMFLSLISNLYAIITLLFPEILTIFIVIITKFNPIVVMVIAYILAPSRDICASFINTSPGIRPLMWDNYMLTRFGVIVTMYFSFVVDIALLILNWKLFLIFAATSYFITNNLLFNISELIITMPIISSYHFLFYLNKIMK